jgi:predicted DNA-binding transcriptional regulator YafY
MLLRGEALDRKRIAGILRVTEATADRHIASMKRQIPELEVARRKRRMSLQIPRDSKVVLPVSRAVGIAACFGSSLATLFAGTPYERGLRDALARILDRVRRQDGFEDADRKFWFVAGGGEHAFIDDQGILDDIVQAVLENKFLKVNYQTFEGERRQRTMRPLTVALHSSHLYLLGFDAEERLTIIRISRIKAAEIQLRSFRFPPREDYDPRAVFGNALGVFVADESHPVEEVEFRLASRWRAYVRTNKWHPSQTHVEEDTGLRVTLTVRICPELEATLLGFGDEAVVLRPSWLRERIASRLEKASLRYRQDK